MKLTVLVDDSIYPNKNLLSEHGLSFYIEADGKKILFDTGCSDIFIKNAAQMSIDLLDLDYIILSHGHYDHTGGLQHYLAFFTAAQEQNPEIKKPTILTHPNTFHPKLEEGNGEIGISITKEQLENSFEVQLSSSPFKITENLTFLGEIPRKNNFEGLDPICKVLNNGIYEDDFLLEDSALIYTSQKGLAIITGCSHSGICNIVDYATEINRVAKTSSIIGGFHLIETSKDKLQKIIEYLSQHKIKKIFPCHCTGGKAQHALSERFKTKDIGVGFSVDI